MIGLSTNENTGQLQMKRAEEKGQGGDTKLSLIKRRLGGGRGRVELKKNRKAECRDTSGATCMG